MLMATSFSLTTVMLPASAAGGGEVGVTVGVGTPKGFGASGDVVGDGVPGVVVAVMVGTADAVPAAPAMAAPRGPPDDRDPAPNTAPTPLTTTRPPQHRRVAMRRIRRARTAK